MKKSTLERFEGKFRKGNQDECWLWEGATGGRGYGSFRFNSRSYVASRMSWMLYNGPIPDGFHICHRCDTPLCVNPNHLFLGTDADNNKDCREKGRSPIGETHVKAKLTEKDILEIRASTDTQRKIAAAKGISLAEVNRIRNGKRWKHVA